MVMKLKTVLSAIFILLIEFISDSTYAQQINIRQKDENLKAIPKSLFANDVFMKYSASDIKDTLMATSFVDETARVEKENEKKATMGNQLQVEVPVIDQWMWYSFNNPRFRISVTNPTIQTVKFEIVIRISDDILTTYQDYSFTETILGRESHNYEYSPIETIEPGFYRATIFVDGVEVRSFNFGYNAEQMVSAPDMQDDFIDFWTTLKMELSQIDPQYTLTEIADKSTSQRKVYLLEMKSIPDGTGEGVVRAFYAEPTAPGSYPAVLHFCGFDEGGDLWIPNGDDNPSQIDIVVSTRGQSINNRYPYVNLYGNWYTYGFGNQETWYYRGAYMDCLRALDFLLIREKVQPENIFAEGTSQGGAFAIFCAAFGDGRINSIAIALPFLGDFPVYFQLVNWAGSFAREQQYVLGLTYEELLSNLSYFDIKNIATFTTCPVYMNFSLQDITCPPHTVWSAYNNFSSIEKQFLTNPELGHKTDSSWTTEVHNFFLSHLKQNVDDIQNLSVTHQEDTYVYNLYGSRYTIPLSLLPHGVYIQQGRKIVK